MFHLTFTHAAVLGWLVIAVAGCLHEVGLPPFYCFWHGSVVLFSANLKTCSNGIWRGNPKVIAGFYCLHTHDNVDNTTPD